MPTGARLGAVLAYIDEVYETVAPESLGDPVVAESPAVDDASLEPLRRDLTGLPLLSDEQLEHIRAMNQRLKNGPKMSPSDAAVQLRVARYLGLEPA